MNVSVYIERERELHTSEEKELNILQVSSHPILGEPWAFSHGTLMHIILYSGNKVKNIQINTHTHTTQTQFKQCHPVLACSELIVYLVAALP